MAWRLLIGVALAVVATAACAGDEATAPQHHIPGAAFTPDQRAAPCPNCVFGPNTYTREIGAPVTQRAQFPANPTAEYIIDIDGGPVPGADALITLNGEAILVPRADNSAVGPVRVRRRVFLRRVENDLRVRLVGTVGSRLNIRIDSLPTSLAATLASVSVSPQLNNFGPLEIRSAQDTPQRVIEGRADVLVSTLGSQVLFLLDSAGHMRGATVSEFLTGTPAVPDFTIQSTALAILMLSPGIGTSDPADAGTIKSAIVAEPCYHDMVMALTGTLQHEPLEALLSRQSALTALIGACVEAVAASHPLNLSRPLQTRGSSGLTRNTRTASGFTVQDVDYSLSPPAATFAVSDGGITIMRDGHNFLTLANAGWRFVSVSRIDIEDGQALPLEVVKIALPGAQPLKLFWLWKTGNPTQESDPTFHQSQAQEANFWIQGLGLQAPAIAPAPNLPSPLSANLLSIAYYLVMPAASMLTGVTLSVAEAVACSRELLPAILNDPGAIGAAHDLARAADAIEFAGAAFNVQLSAIAVMLRAPGLLGRCAGAALAAGAQSLILHLPVLLPVKLGMGAVNITLFANTLLHVAPVAQLEVPRVLHGTLAGVVSSPQLGLLENVSVTADGKTVRTGNAGAYTLPGIRAGSVSVTLGALPPSCVDPEPQSATVVANQESTLNFEVQCAAGSPMLIAHYLFDGNALDATGNGHHGIVHRASPTQDRFGTPGGAMYFDGVDSEIGVPDAPDLRLEGTSFTIAVWARLDGYGVFDERPILYMGSGSLGPCFNCLDHGYGFWYGWNNDLRLSMPAKIGAYVPETPIPVAGRWRHIAAVYDASAGTVTIFADGQPLPVSFTEYSGRIAPLTGVPATGLVIGRFVNNTNFLGAMDDLRIYRGALTVAEIAELAR